MSPYSDSSNRTEALHELDGMRRKAFPAYVPWRWNWDMLRVSSGTPPKFNIAPEKWWLEDYFPIEKLNFQGLC